MANMNFLTGDPRLDMVRKRFPGVSHEHILGLAPDIDAASGYFDVWDRANATASGGDYTFASSAEALELLSSSANDDAAGTGIRTVRVTGLDGNHDTMVEDVTTDGTTAVNLAGTWLRINSVVALTAGSGGIAAGDITLAPQGTGATPALSSTRAQISTGNTRAMAAIYTLPANTDGYITDFAVELPDATASIVASARLKYRDDGGVWVPIMQCKATQAYGGFSRTLHYPFHLMPKADILVECDTDTNNTQVEVQVGLTTIARTSTNIANQANILT